MGKMEERKNDIRKRESERRLGRRIGKKTTGCTIISAVKTRGRTEYIRVGTFFYLFFIFLFSNSVFMRKK